jgi:hypothetical protein
VNEKRVGRLMRAEGVGLARANASSGRRRISTISTSPRIWLRGTFAAERRESAMGQRQARIVIGKSGKCVWLQCSISPRALS